MVNTKNITQKGANLVRPVSQKVVWDVDVDELEDRDLKIWENYINVTLSASGGTNSELTLPYVEQAAGEFYMIFLDSDGNSNELNLVVPDGAFMRLLGGTVFDPTSLDLNADNDCVLLLSTGVEWLVIIDLTT